MEELDTKKVFTDTKDYPLSIIKEMFDDGDIIPQPDYQRDYIMDEKKVKLDSIISGEGIVVRWPKKKEEKPFQPRKVPEKRVIDTSGATINLSKYDERLDNFVKFGHRGVGSRQWLVVRI